MLTQLHGSHLRALGAASADPFFGKIVEGESHAEEARENCIYLSREKRTPALPPGYRAYLVTGELQGDTPKDCYRLGQPMHYLADGDVVRLEPRRHRIHAIYRKSSPSNSLLVTERCDNFCLMCSQPPKSADDSWLVDELFQMIPLMSRETVALGITGGEPALLGRRLPDLIGALETHLPRTAVHVLSNGRAFADPERAREVAAVAHHDLMIGIPVYSDLAEEHDYVVQARGAYTETIKGIIHLKRHKVRVEIRCVIHAETYRRLPELAEFISRNLRFVDHVALMGLELMGFAKTNVQQLWIDPADYQTELVRAVDTLRRAGMKVSVYNHQLCVLDPRIHDVQQKSISDWKNTYFEECDGCARLDECGGFFASSSLRRSRALRRFAPAPPLSVTNNPSPQEIDTP